MFGVPFVIIAAAMAWLAFRRGWRSMWVVTWVGLFFLAIAHTAVGELALHTGQSGTEAAGAGLEAFVRDVSAQLRR